MLSKLANTASHAATAWIVLAAGIVLSAAASYWTANQVEREAKLKFEDAVTDAQAAAESRIRAYSEVLLGVRELFIASDFVSRSVFRDYIDSLDLNRRYPGVQGINYGHRIATAQQQAFVTMVRNDTSVDPRGYPDFAIKPPGDRPEYVVVQYVEPAAGNEDALGLDLGGDPVRLAALERTRDSGQITASGTIALSHDPRRHPGFAMRLPIYRKGMPLATVAQRREAFAGMVSAAFIVIDLMRGVLNEQFLQKIHVRIHDAGFPDSPQGLQPPAAENLLFDSDRLLTAQSSHQASSEGGLAGLTSTLGLEVGGRRWNLYFSARQKFVASSDRWLPIATLLGGITISLLMFGLLRSLATTSSRAVTLASHITRDLRKSEADLAEAQRMTQELIEALPNPIYFKGTDGRYLGVNKAWENFFGVPRDSFIGKTVHDLYPDNSEIADRLHADDQVLWDQPGTRSYETSITTPDKQQHEAIYYKATFARADGSVAGLIGTIIDITERRQAEAVRTQLAAIVENSGDATISRSLDHKILTWNAAAECLFGYTADEAIGQSISLLVPPEYKVQAEQQWVSSDYAQPIPAYDAIRLSKDGRRIDVSVIQSPIKDSNGKLIGASIAFRDITVRKRADLELRRKTELAQLLEALAREANEAATPEPALRSCLARICQNGNWTLGHVAAFTQGRNAGFTETSLWHRRDPGERYEEFIGYSDSFNYNVATGRFTGVALSERRPVWIEDFSRVAGFGRNAVAVKHGLRAGLVLPVIVNGEVTAFLEFFANIPRPADSELMAATESVASMLARLIERASERARRAARARTSHGPGHRERTGDDRLLRRGVEMPLREHRLLRVPPHRPAARDRHDLAGGHRRRYLPHDQPKHRFRQARQADHAAPPGTYCYRREPSYRDSPRARYVARGRVSRLLRDGARHQ